jgi:signal recognition particle receptor subunit beta
MSIVDTRERTINTKVVYYGTGLGGKTTSLQCVHRTLDPQQRVKMVSLNTDEERTLFFDFLPIDLGEVGGYKIRIQGFTVPGQVKYNLTRKYVLMGADAVVFVADSNVTRFAENVLSFENLRENLELNGLDPETIPMILQYNKRDLPDTTPIEVFQEHLNTRGWEHFETVASEGAGVFDGFLRISELMLDAVAEKYGLSAARGSVGQTARETLADLAQAGGLAPR